MINAYDIAWGFGIGVSAPYWLIRSKTRQKVFKAFRERMGRNITEGSSSPTIMIHAVSLGEINATRVMVKSIGEARPDLRFVITVTTDTGFDRGLELYGKNPRVTLLRFPLDFTSAVSRLLDRLRPNVVVLMELEVWPNFMLQCAKREITVLLVNGRLTPGSFGNYRLGGPLVHKMFRRLAAICAQEDAYARRFIQLGADPKRVSVTGTMKFDTAQIADRIDGDETLANEVGIQFGNEKVWLCGSTGPGEESLILEVYREILESHPSLRLVIVPRKPERFDEVAAVIESAGFGLIRRSTKSRISNLGSQISDLKSQISAPVILGDTMGELRKFYSLADVVFVGRTLVDLGSRQHGSDMIEPAALAKPVIIGPFTANFAEVMNKLRHAEGICEVFTPGELKSKVAFYLDNAEMGRDMGNRGQAVVRQEQGATARHAAIILDHLPPPENNRI